MAIEVQTLVFCRHVETANAVVANLMGGPAFRMGPPNGQYPCLLALEYYLLLRKENEDAAFPFSLRITIRDQDSHLVHPSAGEIVINHEFPAGDRFFSVAGRLSPTFPAAGVYSVTARVVSATGDVTQRYDIDLV
jgi:hypothetical protein